MLNNHNLARKQAILSTTGSMGWRFVLEIADQVVQASEIRALQCDEETKIIGLQRQAKAAREFLDNFIRAVEIASQIETDNSDSMGDLPEDWLEVAM